MQQVMIDMIKKQEGWSAYLYTDTAGKTTGAYGRNFTDVPISLDEGELMLMNDIATAEHEAVKYPWFNAMDNANRQDVVVNMIFNMGAASFAGFQHMIASLATSDYEQAAKDMLNSLWATQVGQRAIDLAKIMRTGSF